jgi:hypothetical protein
MLVGVKIYFVIMSQKSKEDSRNRCYSNNGYCYKTTF